MFNLTTNLCPTVLKFVASVIIWIFLSFTLVPFFGVVFTIRFLSSKLVPLLYKDVTKILCAQSSNFAPERDDDICHVIICFELEGNVTVDDVRETFQSRVIQKRNSTGNLQWPELQQYIVHKFGYPFWKWDTSFHIRKHIRMIKVDEEFGLSGLTPQNVLGIIEGDLIHKPYARNQSPWEILVVPNFNDPENHENQTNGKSVGTLLLFHFDHAFGDGSAVSKVFEAFFNAETKPPSSSTSKSDTWWSSFWTKFTFYCFGPYEVLTLGNVGAKYYWAPNTKKTRYNCGMSPIIPTQILKNVQKVSGTTFSSMLIASSGNALNKFMREAGYEVPGTVCCTLPRYVHGHPLTKLVNHFTMAQAGVPMEKDSTQLARIQDSLNACNSSRVPEMYFFINMLLGGLWTKLNQRILKAVVGEGEFAISNLQLYKEELRFMDRNKLRSIFSCGKVKNGGNGILITCAGCKEGIRLLFQIDEGLVPGNQLPAHVFIKYFLQELESQNCLT